jgi:Cu-Zn family superoxide dismutase
MLRSSLAMTGATLLMCGALAGCTTADTNMSTSPSSLASASLMSADGSAKGTATLRQIDGKIELRLEAWGLTPGVHGVHLHTTGVCAAPDFASAGGHLNPHGKMHGTDNPQGSHLGDLPNLTAGADGKGILVATLQDNAAQADAQLFDADGTSIVIHAAADDYRTDPSGNSGGRIACGVLARG